MFSPTPYKVSTITATGSVSSFINLDAFYKHIKIIEYFDETPFNEGFVYIEFGKKRFDTYCKGFHKKMTITRRKKVEGKRFDNQATVVLRKYNEMQSNIQGKTVYNYANLKIFKNGNVQMTGLKNQEQGQWIINFIIDTFKEIYNKLIAEGATPDENIVHDIENVMSSNYRIQLINSDFKLGFPIRRDRLNEIVQNDYNVRSNFESCTYPGVKIEYNWNCYTTCDGVCRCSDTKKCSGKNDGSGNLMCKKVTIAVFQSGSIIITGAQNSDQIEKAYAFICGVCENNRKKIERHILVLELITPPKTQNKKIFIKKINIRVPPGYILDSPSVLHAPQVSG